MKSIYYTEIAHMTQTYNSIPFAVASQICGLAKVKAQIKRLNAADLKDATFEELERFIIKDIKLQIPNFLHPNTSFSAPQKKNELIMDGAAEQNSLPFYRIRTANDFKQDPLLVSSHGVPPVASTPIGRANVANFPVLYLSFLPQSAAYETKVKPNDTIYLSVWMAKKGANFNILSYFLVRDMLPAKWNKTIIRLEKQLDDKLSCYDRDMRRAIKYTIASIQKWYLLEDDYILSSFLSHSVLYKADLSFYGLTCDCILYPSIAEKLKGANLAIGPSAFEKIEIKQVIKMRITGVTEVDLQGDLMGIAKPIDGGSMRWLNDFEIAALDFENIDIRKVHL